MKLVKILLSVVLLGGAMPGYAIDLIKHPTQQLVVAVSSDWDAIVTDLYSFEKVDGQWRPTGFHTKANLGRTGLAWGLGLHEKQPGTYKKEGDGKAPAGVFELGTSFGYLTDIDTRMPYQQMQASHYCMDVNASPLYNQIVDKNDVGAEAVKGSSEPMRLDIHKNNNLYKKGLVVKHNPENVPAGGSCIFMHLWRDLGKPTAGCTAMAESKLDSLLAWLEPTKQPLYVALPAQQYQQLQGKWQLPQLPDNNN